MPWVASILDHAAREEPMADDKPRAPRARKRTTDAEPVEGTTPATKPAAKKKTTAAVPRGRKSAPAVRTSDAVAVRAYLLWEQGEPGDADDHWLRAERELAAA
jgi:hypothetical protein